ncbi:Propionyl-CoA carboxylase alpha chain, mitochondrial [Holothuria leucospilota]|uniref:propionyl-CoA carboxylase n=1 Tax=Holothuria leucospilota TaxID=206669 RepID=A0A9Q1BPA0_HOLLE|nr:Propionyl-CoA carboxylase alpha chain, mitochondrial [Holothuria leucospilota]
MAARGCSSSLTGKMHRIFHVRNIQVPLSSAHSRTRLYSIYTTTKFDPNEEKFDKILIANRGEIACRVMKTCRDMGIKSVAIYSEADAQALHVQMADEAVCVGPPPTGESYNKMENIMEAIRKTGAQAESEGVAFIGPDMFAIQAMGDKIESKQLANAARVNTIPGFEEVVQDDEEAVRLANEIGYPVMLKASAGGGGKGMRIAWNDDETREGFRLSTEEAASSFGDSRLLIEKFIDNPRHIEIQVLCDRHGNSLYLNERECSIQRRNQKVIEEAPRTKNSRETSQLKVLLDSLGLIQHVRKPTHISGHMLDLVITRACDELDIGEPVCDTLISDHYMLQFMVRVPKPDVHQEIVRFRKLKDIDMVQFKQKIAQELNVTGLHPEEAAQQYDSVLSRVLDDFAPEKTKKIITRPVVPWFDDDLRRKKREKRRKEKIFRKHPTDENKLSLKTSQTEYQHKIREAKERFYNTIICDSKGDQKLLFKIVKELRKGKCQMPLPEAENEQVLANEFAAFFSEKIEKIRIGLDEVQVIDTPYISHPDIEVFFDNFRPVTELEILKIVSEFSNATCHSDPIPTKLVKECLDELVSPITSIVNASLLHHTFPNIWKEGLVKPLLKKTRLDPVYSNYRPVSNIPFLSKVIEKAALVQQLEHIHQMDLFPDLQSAYRPYHSTETALLKVTSDILMSMDKKQVTLLVLIDLSSAFDTIDHSILESKTRDQLEAIKELYRSGEPASFVRQTRGFHSFLLDKPMPMLNSCSPCKVFVDWVWRFVQLPILPILEKDYGITGDVLAWVSSYLENRTQRVQLQSGVMSEPRPLNYGVPQGSCYGPVAFLLYASQLFAVMQKHLPQVHVYADDTQLYLAFNPSRDADQWKAVTEIENCVKDLRAWMLSNKLKINDSKTEFMLLGSKSSLAKVCVNSIQVGECVVQKVPYVRNLGVWLDEHLDMQLHITKQCQKAMMHLQDIRSIRKCLTREATRSLLHAFVTSCLDYGNSLLISVPKVHISKLQMLFNVSFYLSSTFLDPETRKAMGQQAVALAKAVNYVSAGTVEFLVDSQKNFYFLEMNTRLQVEHPITECITGIDLVQEMIRIAKGHPLKLKQSDIPINGWAIECRVYAENPYKNFGLPSVGRLYQYCEPSHLPNVRIDSGIREGSEISIYYDSMISKLITYGKDRPEALQKMARALDEYVIKGVKHNISLLQDVLAHEKFISGDISTKFLPEYYPDGFKGYQLKEDERNAVLATACCVQLKQQQKARSFINQKSLMPASSRLTQASFDVFSDGQKYKATVNETAFGYEVHIGDSTVMVEKNWVLSQNVISPQVNNTPYVMQLIHQNYSGDVTLQFNGTEYSMKVMTTEASRLLSLMPEKAAPDVSREVHAPMPGKLHTLMAAVGQKVTEGQEVCVVEAMKMLNSLHASKTGVVKKVFFQVGDNVAEDDVIIEID